jgi:aldehyde dehydrogenase
MGKNFSYGRSILLNKIAQVIEDNLEYLATETIDNGKAIRETMAADIPLAVTILGILLVSFVQKKVLQN